MSAGESEKEMEKSLMLQKEQVKLVLELISIYVMLSFVFSFVLYKVKHEL